MLYGVYNLFNHQVMMPNDPFSVPNAQMVHLAHAPANPREFAALGIQMAEILKRHESSDRPLDTIEKEIVAGLISVPASSDVDRDGQVQTT